MADTYLIGRAVTHMPAGTPAGGQFAPAAGGGGGAAKPAPSNAKPVGQGEKGKRVSDLQARLNALGFKPPLKLDGIFGPKTLAAVKAFQKSHGLKVDGLVGPKTTAALRAKPKAAQHAPATAAAHTPAKTTPTGTGKPPAPVAKASRALAHEKVGHTGKGLWHDKSRQLPAYIQHIANDLMQTAGHAGIRGHRHRRQPVQEVGGGRQGRQARHAG